MFDSEFTQTLLERMGGSSTATLVLDKDGVCIFACASVTKVLNRDPAEMLGKNLMDSLHLHSLDGGKISPEKNPIVKSLQSKDYIQTTPFFCRMPDDGEADAAFAITTISLPKKSKVCYVIVQIRKAQREVHVGEMKTLFVSFAAHQLKTPSSVVKGFLELMIRQGEAAYSADQWNFLISAFESNENLIAVSKTLLNMARLEGGLIEPEIRAFDPNRALQSKIASFAPLYNTKRVTVNLSSSEEKADGHLNSDERFFMEIFGILLGNAIKHSPIGSSINVICNLGNASCEVHVVDNGSGIQPAVREKLFKKGQDSTEDDNSHGLGLYMAKKYIALLGGDIGIADSETGSDFYFTVPSVESSSD